MAITITQWALIRRAFQGLGIYQVNESVTAADSVVAQELLEELIDSWNTQTLTVLYQRRTVYALVSGKGSPTNPYTIGPGGNFDTGTAARPDVIRAANLLLNTASDYPTEIPLAILTDAMQQANPEKEILNAQPSTLYYQRTVPLGTIQLWNVPNTTANQLVLYTDYLTAQFADLTTALVLAPGYLKALRLCLQAAMIPFFSVPMDLAGKAMLDADVALREVKEANGAAMMADLSVDPAFTQNSHGSYVIQTDQGA